MYYKKVRAQYLYASMRIFPIGLSGRIIRKVQIVVRNA